MVKRIKIGLLFEESIEWIAGTYYLINIINALNLLPKNSRPFILLFAKNKQIYSQLKNQYKYIRFYNLNKLKRNYFEAFINKIFKFIFKRDFIIKKISSKKIDLLYPGTFNPFFSEIKQVFWIPDFQHLVLPDFFSYKEIDARNKFLNLIIENNFPIVVSSNSAYNDFVKYFSNVKNKVFILPFAVSHKNVKMVKNEEVLEKYKIKKPFFLCSNQLWQHKNHKVVIDAAKIINEADIKINIIFTGSLNDYRNPEYSKKIIEDAEKINGIKFLGFIDRVDQLVLLQESEAIIQPSLFEGWNTSIEDAKFYDKIVIASDIAVHKEQANNKTIFFKPDNYFELKNILMTFNKEKYKNSNNYENTRIKFAENIFKVVSEVTK